MSDVPQRQRSPADLQFNTAEPASSNSPVAPAMSCALCGQLIASTYFALGDQVLCPECRERVAAPASGSRAGRLLKAALMGLGAGLLGAVIWFVIRRVAHLEIGIVAILVGFMVGKAVRKGSGNQGGLGYQLLAVAITYSCIAANYMPDIVELVFKEHQNRIAADAKQVANDGQLAGPAVVPGQAQPADMAKDSKPKPTTGELIRAVIVFTVFVFGVSLAAPFLGGAQNVIGLLIIAFALWEAWKFNARRPIPISGPYQVGPATAN